MRRTATFGGVLALFLVTTAGCGGDGAATGQALLLVTDAPLDGLVKFEIAVTSVTLGPGNVSVLAMPERLEVTSLAMTTDVLRLASVPAGTYSSATFTFSDAEIKFFKNNMLDEVDPLALINNSVTVPVSFTVAAGQVAGLLIDFDLAGSVQPQTAADASEITGVDPMLSISNVDIDAGENEIEDVLGRVLSVTPGSPGVNPSFQFEDFSSCQGDPLTVEVDGNTQFEDFEPSPNAFSSLVADQVIELDADVLADGTILAEDIELDSDETEDEIEGVIIDVTRDPGGDVTRFDLALIDVAPCPATFPADDSVTVIVPGGFNSFRIDDDGFTVSHPFGSSLNLDLGQKVDVDPVGAIAMMVTADRIKLSDQTIRGTVVPGSLTATTFELVPNSSLFPDSSITVETQTDTRFDDLPNKVASLMDGQAVRVKGLLFRTGMNAMTFVAKRVDGTP
ncbi:MAG: DUF5666 domain-containing protein [Planctomycetota bacterium]|nr:DUF5666 domain-containing protein [Planctomycetota bacterium]